MFCTQCGSTVDADAAFCIKCGGAVEGAELGSDTPDYASRARQTTTVLPAQLSEPVYGTPPQRVNTAGPALYVSLALISVLVIGGAVVFVMYDRGLLDRAREPAAESTKPATGSRASANQPEEDVPDVGGNNAAVDSAAAADTQSTSAIQDITNQATLAASSTLKGYPVSQLIDGRFDTVWSEGVGGYGEGQAVTFTFPSEVLVSEVRIVPGYVKFDGTDNVDRWYSNGRVSTAKLVFSDGSASQEFQFDTDNKNWQNMTLGQAKTTSSVQFVITSADSANTGTSHDAADTSIAEIRVIGNNP